MKNKSNCFVVDTCVVAKLFLTDEEDREVAISLFQRASEEKIKLFAPTLLLYELTHTLIKRGASKKEVYQALSLLEKQIDVGTLEIIESDFELLEKSAEIAMIDTKGQGYISSYDATFHALALFQDAVLITADMKYYRKVESPIGRIVLLFDFDW